MMRDQSKCTTTRPDSGTCFHRFVQPGTLLVCLAVLVPVASFQPRSSLGEDLRRRADNTSPIGAWADDLTDDLEDMADDLGEAEEAVGGHEGPLSEPELSLVADALDNALAVIDRILDANQYPSLTPPDTGYIDARVTATTLPDYAFECAIMAKDALDEAQSTVIDHKVIGTLLKTIQNLITREDPHNYRTEAGIS